MVILISYILLFYMKIIIYCQLDKEIDSSFDSNQFQKKKKKELMPPSSISIEIFGNCFFFKVFMLWWSSIQKKEFMHYKIWDYKGAFNPQKKNIWLSIEK